MITPTGALILLVPVLPIAIWAALSDLKTLKIPNNVVLPMAAVWPLLGWIAVPTWTAWFWGLAIMAIALVLVYLLFTIGLMPGGDGKYIAAMSGIFVGAPTAWLIYLIPGCMIGAAILFLIMSFIPQIRRLTPDWGSWDQGQGRRRIVPFGLALSSMVVIYLVAAWWPQV